MRPVGEPVNNDRVRTLVDLLHRVGRADDLALAARLERALELETKILALSAAERDVLLAALIDPPDSLVGLRGALARDHRERGSAG